MHTTGPERLGLVSEVMGAVTNSGLDILASRATLLGGDFSMMIHTRCHCNTALDKMNESMAQIGGVATWVHDASATTDESHTVGPGRVARVLRMSGNNAPGIIAAVAKYFHKRDVAIMNLASEMGMGLLFVPARGKDVSTREARSSYEFSSNAQSDRVAFSITSFSVMSVCLEASYVIPTPLHISYPTHPLRSRDAWGTTAVQAALCAGRTRTPRKR